MARKSQTRKPYQRRANSRAGFVPLYYDLLDSPAFHDLTPRQKVLYVYCARESHGRAMGEAENRGEAKDETLFYMNKGLRSKVHEIYPESDTRCFREDMAALVEHGFVDCVQSGLEKRENNLFRLSGRWNHWGTSAFSVPKEIKTTYMLRQEQKERRKEASTCE